MIFLSAELVGQSLYIQNLSISSKKNGVSIQLRSDKPIYTTQITGWFNTSTSWYYITIYEAKGDSAQLESVKTEYPIKEIEAIHVGESLQLGFRMAIPVEQFEFWLFQAKNVIFSKVWIHKINTWVKKYHSRCVESKYRMC